MKFSIFTHDNPNAAAPGKSFREDNGELVKETTGALSRSKVETINVKTMAAFKELLRTLNADQHLLSGVSEHDHSLALPAAVLVRSGFGKDKATGLPLVARSNAFFAFPNGPGLLCIDSDTNSQNITFDLVWDALIDACPALAGVTAVQATSSSSLVSGSIRSTGIGGLHTFVGVKDATDIPRALDVLHKRLILAGHTRHRISKTGAFLERTLADRALKVPSQPIYVRASVSGKVRQTKQIWSMSSH